MFVNQLVNSALLAYYSKTGEGNSKNSQGTGVIHAFVHTMSELERRELHQMLSGLSAMQSVSTDAEEARWNVLRVRSQSEGDSESHARRRANPVAD